MINELTKQRADELLDYDPDSGIFTWRVSRGRARAGSPAGCIESNGYLRIQIDARQYSAHRIAWLMTHGEFPPDEIDHIDGDRLNNRISNLRAVTRLENLRNQARQKNNTSGVTGVVWRKDRAKWQSSIKVNWRRKHLGYFDSFDDAVAARTLAEAIHGFHPNHGREAVA